MSSGNSSQLGYQSFTKRWHNAPYAIIDPKRPELSAEGKFIVVTGGAGGLGRATATAFVQAGADTVAVLGRRLKNLEMTAETLSAAAGKQGVRILIESADVASRESLDASVARLVAKTGGKKVDILVHSAGILPDAGPVRDYSESQFRHGLELNVMGAFNTIQAFLPILSHTAHLYNISSCFAHMGPLLKDYWCYAAGKAAVVKMFDYLQAQEPQLRIVQIQPGIVSTGLNARYDVDGEDKPELCGQFIVWLASPEAGFLKGKFVWANWDVEELKSRAEEIKGSNLLRTSLNGVDM